jgi:hypothetical protein
MKFHENLCDRIRPDTCVRTGVREANSRFLLTSVCKENYNFQDFRILHGK